MDSLPLISDAPSWSKLPLNLLHLVFERLGFADFQRAKCVCSFWHSASRESAPDNKIPWLILLPEKGKDYCLLFNPEEKEKIYRIQDLGVDFANSHCLAICGSWLCMQNSRCNLYILNLFTRERIDPPSVESQVGMIKIERTIDGMFLVNVINECYEYHRKHIEVKLPLFWIDEKTKNYVVIWLIEGRCMTLFQSKKGDSFWKQTESGVATVDMVYRDHKLYMYSHSRDVKVLDLSGDIPQNIFETNINYDMFLAKGMPQRVYPEDGDVWRIIVSHLVITVSGEILRVKSIKWSNSDDWSFRIYKLDSSNNEWEKLTSLGEEAILLDQGITVLANAIEGVNKNSIYFSGIHDGYHEWSEKGISIFNLDTHEVERPHEDICSSIRLSDARWCLPNFKSK